MQFNQFTRGYYEKLCSNKFLYFFALKLIKLEIPARISKIICSTDFWIEIKKKHRKVFRKRDFC